MTPAHDSNRVNRAHGSTKENMQNKHFLFFRNDKARFTMHFIALSASSPNIFLFNIFSLIISLVTTTGSKTTPISTSAIPAYLKFNSASQLNMLKLHEGPFRGVIVTAHLREGTVRQFGGLPLALFDRLALTYPHWNRTHTMEPVRHLLMCPLGGGSNPVLADGCRAPRVIEPSRGQLPVRPRAGRLPVRPHAARS